MFKQFKASLKWLVLGATLFFLLKTLKDHWQGVLALRLGPEGFLFLGAALAVTLIAHIWSGWVWGLILRSLGPSVSSRWAVPTYLRTNIAKYLPGNIWHFYGRLQACKKIQVSTSVALLSLVLESLLMAAAALVVAGVSYRISLWQGLGLASILLGVHPHCLNPLMQQLAQGKLKTLQKKTDAIQSSQSVEAPAQLQRYPLQPLLGEIVFVGLRGAGFLLALRSLTPLGFDQLTTALGAFGLAWVLGLIIPGAPGGIGVFEATAVGLLQGLFTPELILGAVAGYRLISTVAEALGALVPASAPQSATS